MGKWNKVEMNVDIFLREYDSFEFQIVIYKSRFFHQIDSRDFCLNVEFEPIIIKENGKWRLVDESTDDIFDESILFYPMLETLKESIEETGLEVMKEIDVERILANEIEPTPVAANL